jgi:hypothetical protein
MAPLCWSTIEFAVEPLDPFLGLLLERGLQRLHGRGPRLLLLAELRAGRLDGRAQLRDALRGLLQLVLGLRLCVLRLLRQLLVVLLGGGHLRVERRVQLLLARLDLGQARLDPVEQLARLRLQVGRLGGQAFEGALGPAAAALELALGGVQAARQLAQVLRRLLALLLETLRQLFRFLRHLVDGVERLVRRVRHLAAAGDPLLEQLVDLGGHRRLRFERRPLPTRSRIGRERRQVRAPLSSGVGRDREGRAGTGRRRRDAHGEPGFMSQYCPFTSSWCLLKSLPRSLISCIERR